jgi:hypothetical protein
MGHLVRPEMTDAVEKVRGILLTRSNRTIGVDLLNRACAFWLCRAAKSPVATTTSA